TVSPGAQANNLTVTPTYSMANSNTMTHASFLNLAPSIKFQPFALDVCIDIDIASGCIGFNPIPDIVLWSSSFDIDFLIPNPKSFTLPGVAAIATDAFDIVGFTYPLPGLSSVDPTMKALNSGGFTLTAYGSGFVPAHTNLVTTIPGSTVLWDGSPRTTTFVDG